MPPWPCLRPPGKRGVARRPEAVPRAPGHSCLKGSAGLRNLLEALLRRGAELLDLPLRRLLGGLLGLLGHLRDDLLAALERLAAGLGGLLLDRVGDRAQLLVLLAGDRDDEPDQESRGRGPDGEAERVVLRHGSRLHGARLHAPGGGAHAVLHGRRGRADAARDGGGGRADALRGGPGAALDPRHDALRLVGNGLLDVRGLVLDLFLRAHLVAERVDVLADPLAGLLDPCTDHFRFLSHWTSSLTLSMVCSGTGGVPCLIRSRPRRASTPATAPQIAATIRAATPPGMARASSRIRHAVSAASPIPPATAPPPNIAPPTPICLPFSASSALASSTSWRTRVETSLVNCFATSPRDASCRSSRIRSWTSSFVGCC